MNRNYSEEKLIRLIKFLPSIIVILFSLLTTVILINNSIEKHNKNINNIKDKFLAEQKIIIKNETLKVVRQIKYQKDLAQENLMNNLKIKIDLDYKIIENIYNENKDKSKIEISKMIKDAIRTIRYDDGRGYFFIYSMDGRNVLLPPAPHMEGKNMLNLQDKKGLYMIKKSINIAKNRGKGFIDWHWYKPNDNETMYRKVGYIKYIKDLDWFIGIGEYFKDFEDEIKDKLTGEIAQIRYGKSGYIFIHEYEGECLTDSVDEQNNIDLDKIIDVARNGQGYIQYKSDDNKDKLSYIVGIDDWQWQVGAGVYLDDINDIIEINKVEFNEKLSETIFIIISTSILLTFILIVMLWVFTKRIEIKFRSYKDSINKKEKENQNKDKLIFEQAKLVSMGEMIGNIAHQWRQPLSIILSSSTSIQINNEFGTLDTDKLEKSCTSINKNAQYLSQTIDDFKNYIKGDRVKLTFNLNDTINSLLHLIDAPLKDNNIELKLDLNEGILVNGYENELIQCLINICNNSKDALLHGDINERVIFLSTKIENNKIIIIVKDTAGGINEDIINKIFEPYFTTKHKSKGTGLGLHMAYDLVVNGMKGSLEAINDNYTYCGIKHTGAKFIIKIPI